MKFKRVVKLCSLILGCAYPENEHRPDMYLPIWLLAFSLALLLAGAAAAVYARQPLPFGRR